MRRFSLVLMWVWISMFSTALAAETMYVRSPEVSLKSSDTASAKILATLDRGTKVEALSKKGSWVYVTAQGQKGWIYKFKLTTTKPSSEGNLLAGLGGGGAKAREGSTAASIRGLSPTSERYAGRARIEKKHVEMVKHVEKLRISSADVETFLKTGRLGEYAEAK